ncbi:hypothetical protein POM88_028734 [Heracleum sosnowskyi]|uniref:Uncharacterized protein n=1 Tax=Heracleum sosnowskyi TaxID=360622 RepID=A0AAD8MGM0_9APIA|nr:hypothetical protein POM88_028734 [Heracleum sosnowskyi]
MISLCFPYKKINLFVDHKKIFETANLPPTSYKFLDVSGKDDEVGGTVVDTGEAELSMDDTEDSDYNFDKEIGSDEEFLSDGEYDSDFASDDELIAARKLRKEHDCDSFHLVLLEKPSGLQHVHCGICRQPGHKRTTCPILHACQTNNDDAGQTNNVDAGQTNNVDAGQTNNADAGQTNNVDAGQTNNDAAEPAQKLGKKRPKLPLKRKGLPGIVIREPTDATSTQDVSKGKMVPEETSKGKTVNKSQTKRLERPFWMQNKNNNPACRKFIKAGRKFITFAENKIKEGGSEEAPLQPVDAFEARLIGPLGIGTIFMPTPGFVQGNHQPNGTPGAGTPPFPPVPRGQSSKPVENVPTNDDFESSDEAAEESNEKVEGAPPRRSTRLTMKKSFKFSNTPDTPVDLDEN